MEVRDRDKEVRLVFSQTLPDVHDPTAEQVARALGGQRAGSQWIAMCPVHADQRPSLTIRDGKSGRTVFHCHAGCSFMDVKDALRSLGILPGFQPGRRPDLKMVKPAPPPADETYKQKQAYEIWIKAVPWLSGTAAERYLLRRGIWTAINHARDTAIRYAELTHPTTREIVPALVVPRMNLAGRVEGIQRIYLTAAGYKYHERPKASLGAVKCGWSVLQEQRGSQKVVLAEGVETALSASLIFGRPAQAACSGFPGEIALPDDVDDVLIAADNDTHGVSAKKSKVLRNFIRATGRRCEIAMPETVGQDFNDVLMAAHG